MGRAVEWTIEERKCDKGKQASQCGVSRPSAPRLTVCRGLTNCEAARKPTPFYLSACATVIALALSAFLIAAVHIPSYLLRAAEDAHLGPQADISRYARVVNYPWPNALAHKEYGFALAEAGLDDQANRELLVALSGLDTGDIYLALAILSAKRGDREQTYHWAAECLSRWPGNPEAKGLIEAQSREGV